MTEEEKVQAAVVHRMKRESYFLLNEQIERARERHKKRLKKINAMLRPDPSIKRQERQDEALKMRNAGMTLKEIGQQLGVCVTRASEICRQAKSGHRRRYPVVVNRDTSLYNLGMSARLSSVLRDRNIRTLRNLMDFPDTHKLLNKVNIGKKSYEEVLYILDKYKDLS